MERGTWLEEMGLGGCALEACILTSALSCSSPWNPLYDHLFCMRPPCRDALTHGSQETVDPVNHTLEPSKTEREIHHSSLKLSRVFCHSDD